MLVVSRREDEGIQIGDDIFIVISEIGRGKQVKLMVHTPRSMKVRRVSLEELPEEVYRSSRERNDGEGKA